MSNRYDFIAIKGASRGQMSALRAALAHMEVNYEDSGEEFTYRWGALKLRLRGNPAPVLDFTLDHREATGIDELRHFLLGMIADQTDDEIDGYQRYGTWFFYEADGLLPADEGEPDPASAIILLDVIRDHYRATAGNVTLGAGCCKPEFVQDVIDGIEDSIAEIAADREGEQGRPRH